MREKGVAPLAIIAAVIVAVAAVGVGLYLFVVKQAGPGGAPSETQPESGTEAMGIPVYGGATGFSIPSDMKSAFGIPENAGCEGYTVTATLQDVVSWYKGQLTDWTLEKENTFSPPDQPNVTIGMLLYKRGDNGAFIFVTSGDPHVGGATILGIVAGPWSLVKECWKGPPEGEAAFDPSLPSGSLEFSYSPIPESSIQYIIPLGNTQPPGHTTPTDHIYFVYGQSQLEVTAPAGGKVLRTYYFSQTNDQSITIGATSSYTYYLVHLHLDNTIKVGDWVEAGQRLGVTAPPSAFDLGVLNANLTLPFANPERYFETRLHADAPLKYFKEPIRSRLYSKVNRTGTDKDGVVCYDQPRKLIGNWWRSDTPPKSERGGDESYAIAFVYSNYEPNKKMVSIGSDFGGADGLSRGAYQAEGPAPENVTPSSGKVAYKLYRYTPGGPGGSFTGERVGLLIVEMRGDNEIMVEAFADTTSETREFTSNAKTYLR